MKTTYIKRMARAMFAVSVLVLATVLPAADKHQGRPEPFAGGVEAISRHPADLRLELLHFTAHKTIERRHVRTHALEKSGKVLRRQAGGRYSNGHRPETSPAVPNC